MHGLILTFGWLTDEDQLCLPLPPPESNPPNSLCPQEIKKKWKLVAFALISHIVLNSQMWTTTHILEAPELETPRYYGQNFWFPRCPF